MERSVTFNFADKKEDGSGLLDSFSIVNSCSFLLFAIVQSPLYSIYYHTPKHKTVSFYIFPKLGKMSVIFLQRSCDKVVA